MVPQASSSSSSSDPHAAASSSLLSPSPASAPHQPSRSPGQQQQQQPQQQQQQQQEYSCILCKQRKVRCDRGNPCSGCVRAGVVCEPGVRQPYKRRKRNLNGTSRDLTGVPVPATGPDADPASRTLASRPVAKQEEPRPERPQLPTFGQYDELFFFFSFCLYLSRLFLSLLFGGKACSLISKPSFEASSWRPVHILRKFLAWLGRVNPPSDRHHASRSLVLCFFKIVLQVILTNASETCGQDSTTRFGSQTRCPVVMLDRLLC